MPTAPTGPQSPVQAELLMLAEIAAGFKLIAFYQRLGQLTPPVALDPAGSTTADPRMTAVLAEVSQNDNSLLNYELSAAIPAWEAMGLVSGILPAVPVPPKPLPVPGVSPTTPAPATPANAFLSAFKAITGTP
jgi:hypothetical protein